MNEHQRRRWLLLVFGTLVAGASGRAAIDLSRALDCYHARRYLEARSLFGQIAQERPLDTEIDFYLGRLALWFDDQGDALAHLERAVSVMPNDARLQNALGDAYGLMAQRAPFMDKLGWARKSLSAYTRAAELDPATPAYHWSLLGFYCVAPWIAGGSMEKAHAQADEIGRLDPAEGHVAQATLAIAEKRYEAAFAPFDSVLRQSPDDFFALYHIGRCAALSGRQVDRGIAALERCLTLSEPQADGRPTRACVHYRLGNLLEKKGDLVAARAAYAAATREHPDFRPEKIMLRN